MLIVTICIGEMFIFLSTKKVREPEAHELIANELKLFQLLKETIQKESELNMNIRYDFHGSRSRAKVINFQPIPPFIFPLLSL